jgi:septum site-determining protein MinC
MKNSISIKGTREGLTITLGDGSLQDQLKELEQHLETQGSFFQHATVALQIGDREIDSDGLTQLSELLNGHEMILRTVVTTNAASQQAVRELGLRLLGEEAKREMLPTPRAQTQAPPRPLEGSKGVLIRHLVRSGQVIRHTGHIVIIGDVNAGSEIIAGGDIVIWGRLQGMVHAGAMGDNEAVVCALDFSPLQLRIGDLIARPAEGERGKETLPEIARVRDNLIVVEPWDRAPRGV